MAAEVLWIRSEQTKFLPTELAYLRTGTGSRPPLVSQCDLLLEKDGIIRCGGRLRFCHLNQPRRHPIFIPRLSLLAQLIIRAVISPLELAIRSTASDNVIGSLEPSKLSKLPFARVLSAAGRRDLRLSVPIMPCYQISERRCHFHSRLLELTTRALLPSAQKEETARLMFVSSLVQHQEEFIWRRQVMQHPKSSSKHLGALHRTIRYQNC